MKIANFIASLMICSACALMIGYAIHKRGEQNAKAKELKQQIEEESFSYLENADSLELID